MSNFDKRLRVQCVGSRVGLGAPMAAWELHPLLEGARRLSAFCSAVLCWGFVKPSIKLGTMINSSWIREWTCTADEWGSRADWRASGYHNTIKSEDLLSNYYRTTFKLLSSYFQITIKLLSNYYRITSINSSRIREWTCTADEWGSCKDCMASLLLKNDQIRGVSIKLLSNYLQESWSDSRARCDSSIPKHD